MPKSTCTIDGCDSPLKGHGFCQTHYYRWRRHGDPLKGASTQPPRPRRYCSVEGCDQQLGGGGRGLCSMHYQRWKINGTAERLRPAGDNLYDVVDLVTGQLTVVKADESRHVSLYDIADHDLISTYRWTISNHGYLMTSVGTRANTRRLTLHRLLLGLEAGDERIGDHISGDRLDNRRANLRIVDYKVNAANQAIINEAGTSKYRGVCWATAARKWKAYAHLDGRLHNLGFYDTEEEAANVVIDFRAANFADVGYLQRHSHTPSKARTA